MKKKLSEAGKWGGFGIHTTREEFGLALTFWLRGEILLRKPADRLGVLDRRTN